MGVFTDSSYDKCTAQYLMPLKIGCVFCIYILCLYNIIKRLV